MLNDLEYFAQIGNRTNTYPTSSTRRSSDERGSRADAHAAAPDRRSDCCDPVPHRSAARRDRALISSQQELATARDSKQGALSSIKVNEQQFVGEANAAADRERCARGEDPRGRARGRRARRCGTGRARHRHADPLDRLESPVVLGAHLAGERTDHEPVRLALPRERRLLVPSGHRHRRRRPERRSTPRQPER